MQQELVVRYVAWVTLCGVLQLHTAHMRHAVPRNYHHSYEAQELEIDRLLVANPVLDVINDCRHACLLRLIN